MSADLRRLLVVTGWALIVGPAIFLADNLLHPEELGRGNEAEQLEAIGAAADRWQIAHMLGFLALLILAAGIVGLAAIAWHGERRLALLGGSAATAGIFAFAFGFAIDGYTWGVLGEVASREGVDASTIELAFGEIRDSAWAVPYYALGAGWAAGVPTIAFAARRGGWIRPRAANLLGVGAVAVALEGLVAENAYFIASAALLLVAGFDTGRDLRRGRAGHGATAST